MKNNPKVSVIVPIYNNESTIRQCLLSILGQSMRNLEVICVDDGSTDKSPEIIDQWAVFDERVKVIHLENGGTGRAINKGLRLARGEWIAECDADDFIDRDMYEQLLEVSEGADIVKSGYFAYYEKDDHDYPWNLFKETVGFCPIELNYRDRFDVFHFQPSFWSAIYRRSFLLDNYIFWDETEGSSFQDSSAIFRATALAKKMVWHHGCFYHWRQREGQTTTSTRYPFAVLYEYKMMEEFLSLHTELQLPLRYILSRLRFGTYSWNLDRIAKEDKLEFARRAAEDLRRDNDYMDMRYYTEDERAVFNVWCVDPDLLVESIEKGRTVRINYAKAHDEGN